jgi:hypothetical protein
MSQGPSDTHRYFVPIPNCKVRNTSNPNKVPNLAIDFFMLLAPLVDIVKEKDFHLIYPSSLVLVKRKRRILDPKV